MRLLPMKTKYFFRNNIILFTRLPKKNHENLVSLNNICIYFNIYIDNN